MSGKKVVLVGDLGTDHQGFPPTPVISGSPNVLIDGKPVARVSDQLAPHSKPKHPPHPRTITSGSSTVFINGLPVAITGGAISCGGVTIGNSSAVVGDTHTPVPFSGLSGANPHPTPVIAESSSTQNRTKGTSAPSGTQLRNGTSSHNGGGGASGATSSQATKAIDESGKTLRLGVFFDGTGNHRGNDQILTNRDVTNVAKLHELYRDDGFGSNYRRIYVDGPGTIDGKHTPDGFEAPEDLMGLGLGVGPEGGHNRIETALRDVRLNLENGDYDEVVFDVFGFSRGAALARHFVNLVNEQPETVLLPQFKGASLFAPMVGFKPVPAFPSGLKVRVNFVGLFDTVGSFYIPGRDANLDFNLNLSPGSAKRVLQLTAYHEIRKNFPLSSIMDANGNGPSHFTEIAVPGAHSDVGGGYENPDKGFENIEKIVLGIHSGLADGGHTQRTAIPQLEAQYARPGRTVVAVPQPNGDIHVQERRRTRKELAIHNLHRMYDFAEQSDVPLRQMNTNDKGYQIPQNLQGALTNWQANGGSLAVARDYLGGYIHTSHSIYKLGLGPEPSGKRTVFYNRPTQAITSSNVGVARAQ
ncbi:type VI secretion system PAAR protein [Marinobacter sp. 71-i]|uniref:Type VI secretion system PAAR protein n=1 Tax=Marinobacter iranensis TaxID=2962607 RepID=A0ABT5YGE2_9GAMM|nr:type VI secretion system PAAR protein [Marinobacter iranensis]MDF0752738.1 type VI secretion system PAAR protein [Marinobacter iranensis]